MSAISDKIDYLSKEINRLEGENRMLKGVRIAPEVDGPIFEADGEFLTENLPKSASREIFKKRWEAFVRGYTPEAQAELVWHLMNREWSRGYDYGKTEET